MGVTLVEPPLTRDPCQNGVGMAAFGHIVEIQVCATVAQLRVIEVKTAVSFLRQAENSTTWARLKLTVRQLKRCNDALCRFASGR